MGHELRVNLTLFLIFLIMTGIVYPLAVLGIGQGVFPHQANGSLIERNGVVIGSELIGQNFTQDIYFHSRPSYAGNGYDASNSSGSNLAPSSADLAKAVADRVAAIKPADSMVAVPVDLVTASGSGLDPHISPASAKFQAPRVAEIRHLDITQVQDLIDQNTTLPPLGILGDARVNVLELNMELDKVAPVKP
jgi:K+-transporting ATPase ATPase C chain